MAILRVRTLLRGVPCVLCRVDRRLRRFHAVLRRIDHADRAAQRATAPVIDRAMEARRAMTSVALGLALLGAVVILVPRGAWAGEPAVLCTERVHAWVRDAGRAAGVPTYAVACETDRVKLRLEPVGEIPLDVQVTRSPAGAFREAGGLGVSPILEVDDFQQVPAARREPFERLVAWMAQHPGAVAFGGGVLPDEMRTLVGRVGVPSGHAWLLVGALALVLAGRFRAARVAVGDWRAGLALVAVALPLRLALGAWGPLHVNGLGPLWIMAAAVDPAEGGAYGPGYAEVFGPLARHLPLAPDLAVFAANAVISALLPALAFVLARLLGIDRRRALVAGILLALDPVSIRIAATESYMPGIAALAAAGSVAAAAAAVHVRRRELRRALAWSLAAGLFCAQAARIHPAAWIPVALAPLAALAVARVSLRERIGLGLGALTIGGATVVVTSGPELLHVYDSMLVGQTMAVTWRWPHPTLILGVLAVGAFATLARPRGPLVPGVLTLLALACSRHNYDQSALWEASFDRLYLVAPLVGAAALLPAVLARTRVLVPAAATILAGLLALQGPAILQGRTTDAEEYRWARQWLRELPSSCRLAYVALAGRRNLFLPTYLASPTLTIARLNGREPIDAPLTLGSPRCTYYVHTSLCTSAEGRPVCDSLERQLVLEPVARASFSASPSSDSLPYDQEAVESTVSRVVGLR